MYWQERTSSPLDTGQGRVEAQGNSLIFIYRTIKRRRSRCSYFTMLRPVTLSCGHSSCQECLANLMASTQQPSCPVCRAHIASDAALNVNIALNNLTSNLAVACTNHDCTWTGTYEKTEDHSKQCPKQKVDCVNEGCQHTLTREEMTSHILTCDKQLVTCTDCGMSTYRDGLTQHLAELCPYKKIYCPLACGEMIPR